jgi:hypothetical protein
MKVIGPYNTCLIILPACFMSLGLLLIIPETLQKEEQVEDASSEHVSTHSTSLGSKLQVKLQALKIHILEGVIPMLERPVLIFALLAMSLNRLSRPILLVTLQYVSAVFGWTLGDVS